MLRSPAAARSALFAALLLVLPIRAPAQIAKPEPQPPTAAPAPPREPLTVMSFNIRYGTAKDGENEWAARRDLLFDVVRSANADLVGLQEALDFQIDELIAAVPIYAVIGVGRDDGAEKGEYSAILFRKDRFHVAEAGTFWFSDTPSAVASKSWGNNITRICSWARLIDRDGRGFYHYNLHLDHQSQPSRERSTVLLRARIDTRTVPDPVIVTGDFNVGESNPALATLTTGAGGGVPPLVDTFRVLHADARDAGTFSNFKFGFHGTDKIDYVLVQPGAEVMTADIVRTSRNNRYPSDHFPVTARVRLVER
jgi:endonuclease/exonuclease/phosphatase family metal-dependent hydrolase